MANALKSQVPGKYDLILKDTGVQVAKGSYAKRTSSYAVPRFSTGKINYSDGSHWQAWAQTEWIGGQYQEFFDDETRFLVSENVEIEPGCVRPGKHAKVLANVVAAGTLAHSPVDVIIVQGEGATYAVVNYYDSGTSTPSVRIYTIAVSNKTMTATLSKTIAGTVCNAACMYQTFLALFLGSSGHPTVEASGNYGLCFYMPNKSWTLFNNAVRIGERMGMPSSVMDIPRSRCHMVVGDKGTLVLAINTPYGKDSGINPTYVAGSYKYGPRPIIYTYQLSNASATSGEYAVTYMLDPVPSGEYITGMAYAGGYIFLGTNAGKIYASTTPNTTKTSLNTSPYVAQKADVSFQLLYDAGVGSTVNALKPYGNGIVFSTVETQDYSPTFALRSDTIHYRVFQLFLQDGAPQTKKLLDLTTKNPYVSSVDLYMRNVLGTYGTDVVCDGLQHEEVLLNNGFGWRSLFADSDGVYGSPQTYFNIGDVRCVVKRHASTGMLSFVYEDNRYIYDNTPGNPITDQPYLISSKFDAGLPSMTKIARRVTLKTRPIPTVNTMKFWIKYSVDGGAWTDLLEVSSDYFAQQGESEFTADFPVGTNTVTFKSIQLKYVWDNGAMASQVDGIEVTDVVLDYVLAPDDAKEWSFKVLATNELQGNDGATMFSRGKVLADALWAAKEAKEMISFVDRDGVEYNALVLSMTEYDPDMAAGKRVDELESFFQVSLLEVSRV